MFNIKLFRYNFSGTIHIVFNQLFSKLSSVGSMWKFAPIIILGLKFAMMYFSVRNRYCHGNEKQKTSKSVKLKFCAIQMSYRKANTNILNYGIWQIKYTSIKKIMYVWFRINCKNISNLSFCIIIVNGPRYTYSQTCI